jgi:hypothetical protein
MGFFMLPENANPAGARRDGVRWAAFLDNHSTDFL